MSNLLNISKQLIINKRFKQIFIVKNFDEYIHYKENNKKYIENDFNRTAHSKQI